MLLVTVPSPSSSHVFFSVLCHMWRWCGLGGAVGPEPEACFPGRHSHPPSVFSCTPLHMQGFRLEEGPLPGLQRFHGTAGSVLSHLSSTPGKPGVMSSVGTAEAGHCYHPEHMGPQTPPWAACTCQHGLSRG